MLLGKRLTKYTNFGLIRKNFFKYIYIYQFFVCCQSRNLPLRGQILKEIIFIETKQRLLATTKISGNSEILHFRGPMILTDNDS